MNSATSTEPGRPRAGSSPSASPADQPTFLPWHFFLLAVLASSTAAVLAARGLSMDRVVTLVLIIGAAGCAGLAVFRTLQPLVRADAGDQAEMVGRRTRAALGQQKALVLRALKELEFDHAMGKVSEADFEEMTSRLRARAVSVIRQLEGDNAYRTLIERELAERLANRIRTGQAAPPQAAPGGEAAPAAPAGPAPRAAAQAGPFCTACGTRNEVDARFCKACGHELA